jgi:N-acetylglucosaminyldiphosphoundecaprenol N-acetyl-beta-D-mannosaminyltransferase
MEDETGQMDMIQRCNILGVGVSAINMAQALERMDGWVRDRSPHYVCVTPAHAVMDVYRDKALRQIYNQSGLTTPDGMAIVWLMKWYGHSHVERVYGPDLLQAVCAQSAKSGYRHYFYGAGTGVAQMLSKKLQARFPGLQVVGEESPPFRPLTPEEDIEVVARIRNARPDFVWVGIGSPRQEHWMSDHLLSLDVPVLVGIGAAFDFISGNKPQAPRWMQRSGLEWLFRLLSEPRRLWRRYIQYPKFVVLAVLQRVGVLKFPM